MWDHLQVIEKLENEEGHRKKNIGHFPPKFDEIYKYIYLRSSTNSKHKTLENNHTLAHNNQIRTSNKENLNQKNNVYHT